MPIAQVLQYDGEAHNQFQRKMRGYFGKDLRQVCSTAHRCGSRAYQLLFPNGGGQVCAHRKMPGIKDINNKCRALHGSPFDAF